MKVLLLFGAGASLGAGGLDKQPPLGNDLFNKLCEEYPHTWGSTIPSKIANILRNDFEEGMVALCEEAMQQSQYNMARLLKDMGLYFSGFHIKFPKKCLYYKLVERFKGALIKNEIVLSTLNYECLIEYAMLKLRMDIDYFGDGAGARLLKPHGSCHFMPRGIIGGGSATLNMSCDAITNTEIDVCPPTEAAGKISNTLYPPSMSLYIKEKTTPVAPKAIQKIRNNFISFAHQAKTIITIGVKPNQEDTHIWKPITESTAKVFLVANKAACEEWISKYRNTNVEYIGDRFHSSYDRLYEEIKTVLLAN